MRNLSMNNFNDYILLCTHKPAVLSQDPLYYPIQLGVDEYDFDLGINKDNIGDNISYKHRFYSEFSAVYWAWKNLNANYIGCCHYRRYFLGKYKIEGAPKNISKVLTLQEFEILKNKYPNRIFVAKKRNYFIETIYQHYEHTHNIKDLDAAIELMRDKYPSYYDTFVRVLRGKTAHMFNAFIMPKNYYNSYCEFLFGYLFEYEKVMNVDGYNEYESRLCGYIGELLLETWIRQNNIPFKEIRYGFVGKKNWIKKILNFLKTKYIKSERTFSD